MKKQLFENNILLPSGTVTTKVTYYWVVLQMRRINSLLRIASLFLTSRDCLPLEKLLELFFISLYRPTHDMKLKENRKTSYPCQQSMQLLTASCCFALGWSVWKNLSWIWYLQR